MQRVYDPQDPFNTNARPNAWTPPLNTSWNWGADHVYGVNLGGLFVLEPFISPALYQKYPGAVDEWTLSELMAADNSTGRGLRAQLEAHYDTFIVRGLNCLDMICFIADFSLRQSIETWDGEPFLPKVCWKYILRVFEWARKYGLRIYLDLHTVRDHKTVRPGVPAPVSYELGQVNFMNGIIGVSKWADFLPGSDRIILDTHPYFVFDGQPNNSPLVDDDGTGEPGGVWPKQACSAWGPSINTSRSAFGVTVAGEFSNGYNDCGLFVNGVGNGASYKGDCSVMIDWANWNTTFKPA
ncbi:hypothetical protein EW146_g10148 [Bondarzewia mesenterica]|uniref:glucan 1,3-beta-glucosidase n=1 Tax=Bondarzewia mesenterica TaxID=1095465 RepID=A0A4S4L0J0_9AGAM|nr:hypothetical protein EW146_g10148 [Bondarzewia mesenterica]